MFKSVIPIQSGEIVNRDGFVFADVLPAGLTGEDQQQFAHLCQALL